MRFPRRAGILLHPTSLPGKFGIGDLGYEAYNFINFLEAAGQMLWQVFPLGPTGYGDSPYQCFSAFAGNPNLISPEKLRDYGLLKDADIANPPQSNPSLIDFGFIIKYKKELNRKAFEAFKKDQMKLEREYLSFKEKNEDWLDDFSLFMSLKDFHLGSPWSKWDNDLITRKPEILKKWKEKLSDEIEFYNFCQFIFDKQWHELKKYANSKNIEIIGDIPIFVAYDSADVWAQKEMFTVDKEGNLVSVAGVPPDYFSETGQLWGNPLFNWKAMEKEDFVWWRRRISHLLSMVDVIRIDHFRGFEAYWEIPGGSETAVKGRWVKAPGEKLFKTIEKFLGELPIMAEDLGVITKAVTALREKFNFPGMKILQFAFGTGMETKFLPHNIPFNSTVFTGSHDNDTTRGYFEKARTEGDDIFEHTQRYLNYYGNDLTFELIRTAYRTAADTVIIPMQDVLNLGSEARMNYPGKLGGNWTWRFTWDQVPYELASRYKALAELYERPKIKKEEDEDIEIEEA